MSSYTKRSIVFFVLFYTLLIPSTMINALAEGNIITEKSYAHLKKNNDNSKSDTPYVLVNNIQTVSHVLSSSPSELAEQAKSYALSKVNGTVSSEMQKWLSQFGSARIYFGLDKKGTLKNNSLDLLLPFYDSKTDWLFFSQLGYRNKDSRNIVNVGLGGRYFYQNWMYGLNTFYDHDITGKNQRLGLGGEIWGDYIKFSTNAYYHLSSWQESQNFDDYHERAANGYDITGEFFLPAYPNLGAKLTYEQYLGNNVMLFDSDTKQKNPSLATLGLTYTPFPLFKMGMDYKQGESGHTETQFLANLNYKFGVPLNAQLSSDNVSLMRTLAGSRYDLVERNNNIVLEHQKKEKAALIELEPIVGYGHQEIKVNSPVPPDSDIKQIKWVITDKEFHHNNGKLSSESGNSITITLPSYQETHQNDYILNILPESIKRKQVKPIEVHLKVLPFLIDGQVNIVPPELPTANGKKENGYTFDAPVITYDGSPSGTFVKNARIDKVNWSTEPALSEHSGLKFMWNNEPAKTNEKGELTDEKGKLKPNELVSTKPYDKVDVYIQLDGAPRQKIGSVKFSQDKSQYKIKDGKLNVTPDPKIAQVADGIQKYTYTANIIANDGLAVDEVDNVKWSAVGKNSEGKEVKNIPVDGQTGTVKTHEGKLTATLSSKIPLKDVVVTLSIENKASASAEPVSFVPDIKSYRVDNIIIDNKSPLIANDDNTYTYTAYIVDRNGSAVPEGQKISNINWAKNNNTEGLKFTFSNGVDTTGPGGTLTAKLVSTAVVDNIVISLAVENQKAPFLAKPVAFIADTSSYHIDGVLAVDFKGPLTVGDGKFYTFKAVIVDRNKDKVINQPIDAVIWKATDDKGQDVKLRTQETRTNDVGELLATLDSSVPLNGVKVSLAIEHQAAVTAEPVSIKPENIYVACKASGERPVLVTESYTCTAKITDAVDEEVTGKIVNWKVKNNSNLELMPSSGKTDNNGEVTATLTSHVDTQDLVVTASVDGQSGEGESKEKISFVWTEITIERSPKDHDITVGSQGKYQLTATVWREKDKTVYKGQEITFKWTKPQLEDGTEAPDTNLSPPTDIPQSVNSGDGTLKADIESNKVQQVKACIYIDGKNPASAVCSGLMKFVEPPVEFDIVSVEVTDFNENKPLSGDGISEYHYKALIVKKGTTDPVVNHKFEGVKWVHNYTGRIEAKKLPLPEAYSPTNDDPFKTDKDGFLYATLKSHVGVEKVKVTLTIPKPDHTTAELDADKFVEFSPVPQPAVLYVYRQGHEKQVNKFFDNTNGKDHPHTFFSTLRGELRDPKKPSVSFAEDEITYGIIDVDSPIYGDGMLDFGADNRGPIQFITPGSATITSTINKESGEIQLYEYKMSAIKAINFSSGEYKTVIDEISCDNNSAEIAGFYNDLFSDKEASSADIYSLHNEFGNLFDWGVFVNDPSMEKDKVTFIVKNTDMNENGEYRIYDAKNNKFDNYNEGVILCYTAIKNK
ncbi:inverse autotransporter beta domain-containing protein [Xenorhabdus sp. IM139775]|uniref:inverse autotransporter beta domain-containing protein n=1 Tax=Xenorhabdus sp. IM139775 TaxID=3025876 RepID=UPI0023597547|nr:inverse autotransporter beta domain-containing protein [Xenorhabdus sp. IM139775]MDC9593266.1 inverse autotransporter beta domain-containing protein [Xenorhabdus sp. IM139775]